MTQSNCVLRVKLNYQKLNQIKKCVEHSGLCLILSSISMLRVYQKSKISTGDILFLFKTQVTYLCSKYIPVMVVFYITSLHNSYKMIKFQYPQSQRNDCVHEIIQNIQIMTFALCLFLLFPSIVFLTNLYMLVCSYMYLLFSF